MKIKVLTAFLVAFVNFCLYGQDPNRFSSEIERILNISVPEDENVVVFTGSSSIRFWQQLDKDCDGIQVVNTGFGGSQMSDLLYFLDQTVLRFQPTEVYIYEGDNDIAVNKKPEDILTTTKQVVTRLRAANPDITIRFISAKPSPARWALKNQYEAFNRLLKNYCAEDDQLFYIDVWNPMLDTTGRPSSDIFISDSLHMNRAGYLIWKEVICEQ